MPAYPAAQNRLIEGFAARGLPIVRVFHVRRAATPAMRSRPPAARQAARGPARFRKPRSKCKTRHSALVGTGWTWLTEQGITQIVVSGLRTEQCCETTTRHASDLGWKVVFVPEATLTFDMALPDGTPFRAADIGAYGQRAAGALRG